MKTKNLLKKAFLLLALIGGASSVWATETIGLTQTVTDDGSTHTVDAASYTGTTNITVVKSIGSSCGDGFTGRTVTVGSPSVAYSATKAFRKTVKGTAYTDDQYVGYTIAVATGYTLTLTNLNAEVWSSDATMNWRIVVIDNATSSTIYTSSDFQNNSNNKGTITVASPSGLTKLSAGTYTVKLQMYQNGGNKYFVVPSLTFDATVEESVTPPGAISFMPAAGSVAEGTSITLASSGASTIEYQWGTAAIGSEGDWSGAVTYSGENKPVVPAAGSVNTVLSVKATNANGSTYGSAAYTPVKMALKTIYSFVDGIGSQEVTAIGKAETPPTIDGTSSMSLKNTGDQIKLTAATGFQFKSGDAIEFSGSVGNTLRDYGIKYGPTDGLGTNLFVAAGQPCHVSGTLTLASETSDLYIARYGGTTTNFTTFTIRQLTAATSETFTGVKIGGSAATVDEDYTIDESTITLTGTYTAAPNVVLVNHIVFADESTEDQNLIVAFGNPDGEFFTGTATIDGTTYTIKAPCGQINALKVEYKDGGTTVKEEHIDVTGLKVGASYIVPFRMYVEKDGALYQTTKNGSDPWYGDAVTLEYNTTVTKSVSSVDLGGGTLVLFEDLDGATSDYANVRASNCSSYNNTAYTSASDLPAGKYTFIVNAMNKGRGSSIAVGSTTVAGIADIVAKNNWGDKTFTDVIVPADGKLTLVKGGSNTIDYYDILIAIRTGDAVVNITPANNWSTYVTSYALDFSDVEGLKAYVATNAAAGSVTLSEVGSVPAGTPLMLVGTASTEYTVPVVASASAPAVNMFRAGDGTTEFNAESTISYDYILFTDGKFYRIATGTTVPVGKAYLHCDSDPIAVGDSARGLRISFGDITGIDQVDNGQVTMDSSLPVKRVVNGKLVIEKNGKKYNAAGAKLY